MTTKEATVTDPDPFERAVHQESKIRRRYERMESRGFVMKLAFAVWGSIWAIWGLGLLAHWLWFAEPRWAVAVNSVLFGLATLYLIGVAVLFRILIWFRIIDDG